MLPPIRVDPLDVTASGRRTKGRRLNGTESEPATPSDDASEEDEAPPPVRSTNGHLPEDDSSPTRSPREGRKRRPRPH